MTYLYPTANLPDLVKLVATAMPMLDDSDLEHQERAKRELRSGDLATHQRARDVLYVLGYYRKLV